MPYTISKLEWSIENGLLACGGKNGMQRVLKLEFGKADLKNTLSMNQVLQGHSGTIRICVWNEIHKKLITCDDKGLIIFWALQNNQWCEESRDNRKKSMVKDIKWISNGEIVCIAYEDGNVILANYEGDRKSVKSLDQRIAVIEWSPDGKYMLVGAPTGEIKVYDNCGKYLLPLRISKPISQDSILLTMIWFTSSNCTRLPEKYNDIFPTLCIVYENGNIQLMKNESDNNPLFFDVGLNIKCANCFPQGSVLAFGGIAYEDSEKMHQIKFYNSQGVVLHVLKLNNAISSFSFEGNGMRMALGIENEIIFANVQYDYLFTFFNETLVYAYQQSEREDHCTIFWNVVLKEKFKKYFKNVLSIKSAGVHCGIVTKIDYQYLWAVLICNSVGSLIEEKEINIEPIIIGMSKTHVVISNGHILYVWKFSTKKVSFNEFDKAKIPIEYAFSIDESSDIHINNVANTMYTATKSNDPAVCLSVSEEKLIVGRSSGRILIYSLPHLKLQKAFLLNAKLRNIAINCMNNTISVIDSNGALSFYDLENHKQKNTGIEHKDVWSLIWSSDNPNLLCFMKKHSMYIMSNFITEQPVNNPGYLVEFQNLEIKVVLIEDVMQNLDKIQNIQTKIISFETKTLRDTKDILSKISLEEAEKYVEKNSHPRLWKLIAEEALKESQFNLAEKAYLKLKDYFGVKFTKRIQMIDDIDIRKGEIAAFYGRFEEAEQIYRETDNKNLIVDLWYKIGDYKKVIKILKETSAGDDKLREAYNALGEHYYTREKWAKAAKMFALAKNYYKLIDSYYSFVDLNNLKALLEIIPEDKKLLEYLAQKLNLVGMPEYAVEAYIKIGDTKKVVDTCILLSDWKQVVELAEKHNFIQKEGLVTKYANRLLENKQYFQAIDLYRNTNRNKDAGRVLLRLADDLKSLNFGLLILKKIYVLAALEVDSYKKSLLGTHITGTGANAVKKINSLMKADDNTSTDNKALNNPWIHAEAFHFLMICQRQLYQHNYRAAFKTAMRLIEHEKLLGTKHVYSLIALSALYNSYYKECSKAFVKLESIMDKDDNAKLSELANKIFSSKKLKFKSKNEEIQVFKCPGKNCEGNVTEIDTNCLSCGIYFPACVASGQSIFVTDHTYFYQCKNCKHKSLERELKILAAKFCPLCHSPIIY